MGRDISGGEVIEYFTLDDADRRLIRDKAAQLGFAVMLKFLLWRGRFPRGRHEIPDDAIAHVARQLGVSVGEVGFYDLTNRQASNHRAEIRRYTGFRVCTVGDADKLASWLAGGVAREGGSSDYARAELLRHCKAERIEPPTSDRVKRIVESGLRQAQEALVDMVVCRLGAEQVARIETFAGVDANDPQDMDPKEAAGDADEEEPDADILASIKADPGNVSLASILAEIARLEAVRAVDLPDTLFTDISPKVVTGWRARAAVESPSHLRRHTQPVRLVLLAALLHQWQREIIDTLVELLNSCIHKINARAEKQVTAEFVRQYKRIRNKDAMLHRVAEVSLESPEEPVREVIYPVMGGEAGLTDLLREYRARRGYERDKRRVFRSSYTNHYRTGLIKLLRVLEFRSNNTEHQPVLDGLKLILRYAEAKTTFYRRGETVALDGVLKEDWREFAVTADHRGRPRVVRHVYECCVLIALRDRLRCKEIWVVGADKWRNPDDDLPADFEAKRAAHYHQLGLPLDATAFASAVKAEMSAELAALNDALPRLAWLSVSDRHPGGPIKLTPLDPVPEPRNLRRLKKAIRQRWGTVPLIEILKEAALRTPMLRALTSAGTRDAIPDDVLFERLLLIAYGYGTNSGLRTVAAADHGHSEEDLRYTARRYVTPTGLKAAGVEIANATFAARAHELWGEGTTTVASDSTHFGAYDRNIFTEWHSRYGGRGILVYWSVERGAMAIHSQVINCSASEVAAMIEGVMRHGTSMKIDGNFVDSHGQSEIGFGVTRLLGFDLLPGIKRINKVKLYRPGPAAAEPYPRLEPAMTRPIRWDLIEDNYDMVVKYATAIRVGTASTEALLPPEQRSQTAPRRTRSHCVS